MAIPFTQYLRPNGRTRKMVVERNERIEAVAAELVGRGVRFEIEVLNNGVVSMTAEIDDGAGETSTLAQEVVENGPEMSGAVDALVLEAQRRYALWRAGGEVSRGHKAGG